MEFALLGPLEVRADGRPLSLGPPKQRALLVLLLLNANRVVSRGRLIDALWGESPPETASKALQVYVSRLRKVLPAGVLLTKSPGYLLAVDPDALDLLRFERLVKAAREAAPADAASQLREALGLWRGSPLAEFGEPFARIESGRLDDLRLTALEQRIQADLALGRHAELVGELEALAEEHPERERLRGLLMLALYRSGRQAEALETYQHARHALDELGLEPGTALKQLERQILAQDSTLELQHDRPPRAAVVLPGALVPAPPFPFVGRERELAELRTLLERAAAGEGGLVLVGGEAGAGKTRLVRELALEASARGMLVLYGASDAAVSTPYEPPRAWLEFLLRTGGRDSLAEWLGERGEILSRLLPELESLTGTPAPPARDPAEDRYALQSALSELLRRVSLTQPLLLVADDLHWADGETLHLLRRLARLAPEARLLLLAAYRDRGEEPEPVLSATLADLSRLDGVTRLVLGNLDDQEVGEFIRGTTGASAEPGLASALGALTEGTPLLLCELWRDLRALGAVEVTDDGVRLTRPLAEIHGPEHVRDLVQHRLRVLAPGVTQTLEHAAVLGPHFELRVLAAATGIGATGLATALEQAGRSGILEELPEAGPSYRFTHELVRRAVYDQIPAIHRAALHLRAGEALERLEPADSTRYLPELAHHFTLAAPAAGPERAVDYNLRAAEGAIAAAAYNEAATSLRSALDVGIDDPRERARIQVELAFLLNETGQIAEAAAVLARSLEAATGLEERGTAARALLARASDSVFADLSFDAKDLEPGAQEAIETLGQLGDSVGVALARRLLGLCRWRGGNATEGLAELERALAAADASDGPWALRRVVTTMGGVLSDGPVTVGEATRRCDDLLATYGSDLVTEAVITRFLSLFLAMAGRFDEARDRVERSSVVLDELEHVTSWVYRRVAAETKRLLGDRRGAEHELIERWRSLRHLREDGVDGRAVTAACQLSLLYAAEDRWDEAAEHALLCA